MSAARSKAEPHNPATRTSKSATRNRTLDDLRRELRQAAEPARIPAVRRALQIDRGGYGEGDTVIGVSVPNARAIARRFADLRVDTIVRLLRSPIHEERLVALLLLTHRFETADEEARERIFRTYLVNTAHVNDWDLVDTSAPSIVGAHLLDRPREPLRRLARAGAATALRDRPAPRRSLRRGRVDRTWRSGGPLLSRQPSSSPDVQPLAHFARRLPRRPERQRALNSRFD